MNIHEMHNRFRTIGQQMGMQLIRSILPESIDVFINQAINEKIRNILMTNTNTVFNDKVSIQDNKVSSINALRTLISKYTEIDIDSNLERVICHPNINNVFVYTSFSVKYENDDKQYPCRLIDNDNLENTLNDFCNSASYEYPIVTFYNEDDTASFEIFIGNDNKTINSFMITYIKNPTVVKWNDNIEECVNCDLPDYLHDEIVEIAVNKFISSVNVTSKRT